MSSLLHFLNDPDLAWSFQSFCGVEKLSSSSPDYARPAIQTKYEAKTKKKYNIKWPPLYWFALLASFTGSEEFYGIFFPFWWWNIDVTVARKSIFVVVLCMYIGQAMKDVLQIERPASPPVVKLESFYILEFGMPSTHSLISVATPLSTLIFQAATCDIITTPVILFVILWPLFMALTRVYLGVHTFLQVLTGLSLGVSLVFGFVPVVDAIDHWLMSTWNGPLAVTLALFVLAVCYPSRDGIWSDSWSDTVALLSFCSGAIAAGKMAYFVNISEMTSECTLPGWSQDLDWTQTFLKTVLGFSIAITSRAIWKIVIYGVFEILVTPRSSWVKSPRNILEVIPKYVTYWLVAVCTLFVPQLIFYYANM